MPPLGSWHAAELGAGAAGKMKVIEEEGSLIKTSADRFLVVFTALPQVGDGIAAGVQNGRHLAREDCRVPTLHWLAENSNGDGSFSERNANCQSTMVACTPGANWGHACLVT